MKKLVIINSHPIQYFAPLYSYLSDSNLEIEVWYCSDESITGSIDKQFGSYVKWDIPLLLGYKSKFLKNNSWKPSIYNGFLGLINLKVISDLFKLPKSVIIIHGWSYASYIIAIFFGKIFGHEICLRGESPLNQELHKSKISIYIRKLFFNLFLNICVDKFLYIGEQNKKFYEFYGVDANKLLYTPYAIDNHRFQKESFETKSNSSNLKKSLGLNEDKIVILFSGKFIDKKKPILLINAFKNIYNNNIALIMVGEGMLRSEMEDIIKNNNLQNVVLTGFINQSEISKWYNLADVFVMSSSFGETWGLSVNEMMNFSKPVLVSDAVGCAVDLVINGENGYTFVNEDIRDLQNKLEILINMNQRDRDIMGNKSLLIINNFSFEKIAKSIKTLFN